MTITIYTIKDFEEIGWSNTNITLPQETIDLITTLTDQVAAPNYVKTPSFSNNHHTNEKTHYRKNNKHVNNQHKTPEDWEAIRNFQKTEFVKKEGLEKDIDNIRLLINKLTDKTYDKIIVQLTDTLDEIVKNDDCDATYTNKIGYAIFNMATSNKFNSNVYARLSSVLQTKYDFITDIITHNITEFMKLFENMVFVSPEVDYDKFCDMNIVNEKRRSMSLFLVNLYKNKVLTLDFIFDTIKKIQNMIVDEESLQIKDKSMEIDELSENLYVMLTNIPINTLKKHDDWSNIYNNLLKIKNINCKENMGISSKTKFKHMDILDRIKIK